MKHNLNFLSIKLDYTALGDCSVSHSLSLELDVAELARLAIRVDRELSRLDSSELLEGLAQLLLSDFWVNRLDHDVCLWLHLFVLLDVAANKAIAKFCVVKLSSAASGLSLVVEVQEAITVLAFRLLVNTNQSSLDVVAKALDMFE